MRIQKQSSGGRGEYEIAEHFEDIAPSRLFDKEIWLDFGAFGLKRTQVALKQAQGKRRLRRLLNARWLPQIPRQVHAALMLPKPIRDESRLEGGQPVVMRDRCIMGTMQIGQLRLDTDRAVVRPASIQIENGSGDTVEIDVSSRLDRIREVLERQSSFSTGIGTSLEGFGTLLHADGPIRVEVEMAVEAIMQAVAQDALDSNVDYVSGMDVLSALEQLLEEDDTIPPAPPTDLLPLDAIHQDEIEIRRRETRRRMVWMSQRGASSRRFSRDVKIAYSYQCVLCGMRLPASPSCPIPGVDAAHIFAWCDTDLDIISNGLCLCKQHHWAFDSYLIAIEHVGGAYHARITTIANLAFAQNTVARRFLEAAAGIIPQDRFPQSVVCHPSPYLLSRRNEELGIEMSP